MAVPSHGFRDVLTEAAAYVRSWVPVVSLAKGLEPGTLRRMSQVVAEVLAGHPVAVLTGPNLAHEILAGQPAASVVATADDHRGAGPAAVVQTPSLRIYTNADVVGCEIAGVVKNVLAIAAGMAEGMGFGDNTKATLFTRGLAELTRLGVALGGDHRTFAGLAGLGDLVATCSQRLQPQPHGGRAARAGPTHRVIVADMRQVAEGIRSSASVLDLARRRRGRHAPVRAGGGGVPPRSSRGHDAVAALMQRDAKPRAGRHPPAVTPRGRHIMSGRPDAVWAVVGQPGRVPRSTRAGGVHRSDGPAVAGWWAPADRWHDAGRGAHAGASGGWTTCRWWRRPSGSRAATPWPGPTPWPSPTAALVVLEVENASAAPSWPGPGAAWGRWCRARSRPAVDVAGGGDHAARRRAGVARRPPHHAACGAPAGGRRRTALSPGSLPDAAAVVGVGCSSPSGSCAPSWATRPAWPACGRRGRPLLAGDDPVARLLTEGRRGRRDRRHAVRPGPPPARVAPRWRPATVGRGALGAGRADGRVAPPSASTAPPTTCGRCSSALPAPAPPTNRPVEVLAGLRDDLLVDHAGGVALVPSAGWPPLASPSRPMTWSPATVGWVSPCGGTARAPRCCGTASAP